MMKRSVLLLSAALVLGATALPAAARVNLDIDIGVPPPAPVYEAVPAPQVGFVWAPGYWGWGPDGRHVWIKGRYIRENRGHHWVADHWESHDGRHHFVPGRWER
jgi:WXXGXW repeat (2 copies)